MRSRIAERQRPADSGSERDQAEWSHQRDSDDCQPTLTEINLQGGNDKLNMNGYVGGIVAALMGSGNDVVRMTSVVNDGAILFDLGSGK